MLANAEGCLQYLFENNVKLIPKTDIEKIFTKCEAGNLKLEILPNGDTIGCTALNNEYFRVEIFLKYVPSKLTNSSQINNDDLLDDNDAVKKYLLLKKWHQKELLLVKYAFWKM